MLECHCKELNCLLSPAGKRVPSLKIIRFSKVFLLVLSVGVKRWPRFIMSSVERLSELNLWTIPADSRSISYFGSSKYTNDWQW